MATGKHMIRSKFSVVAALILCCGCDVHDEKGAATMVEHDTIVVHDTVWQTPAKDDWQRDFGLTHDPEKDSIWGKPVNYYLDDSTCAGLASDFYFGYLRPTDNGATGDLLALVTTDNDKLRPLYRWCLSRTIEIADGALGEYTGQPARRYVEKFPREFVEYIKKLKTGVEETAWAYAITYSGCYDYEGYDDYPLLIRIMTAAIRKNCRGCDKATIARLERFVDRCYGRSRPEWARSNEE